MSIGHSKTSLRRHSIVPGGARLSPGRGLRAWGVPVALMVAVTACAGGSVPDRSNAASTSSTEATVAPTAAEAMAIARDRSVVVAGDGCGDAGGSLGSGIAVGPGRVLTAAHVVIGSSSITVSRRDAHPERDERGPSLRARPRDVEPDYPTAAATIVAFDPLRDLALLEVPLSALDVAPPDPVFRVLGETDPGTIIGGLTSGDVTFTVTDKTIIETDEVRGDGRSQRSGYLVEAETARGDSGAGLYDRQGRLAGLLFAVSTEDSSRSWATAADEIEEFLADGSVAGAFSCNPDRSLVERLP